MNKFHQAWGKIIFISLEMALIILCLLFGGIEGFIAGFIMGFIFGKN